MKGIRQLLRRYLVPTILLGGLVTVTTFYFVNQPQFSGDLVNGVLRMDWGDVEKDQYRSVRADLSRRIWGLRIYHQNPSGTKWAPGVTPTESRWDFGVAAGRRISGNEMPLWEMQVPTVVGVTAVTSLPLLLFATQSLVRFRRVRQKECLSCGYSTTGWLGELCPECGKKHRESRSHFGIRATFSTVLLLMLIGGSIWQIKAPNATIIGPAIAGTGTNQNNTMTSTGSSTRMISSLSIPDDIYKACDSSGVGRADLEWIVYGDDIAANTTFYQRLQRFLSPRDMENQSLLNPCWAWLVKVMIRGEPVDTFTVGPNYTNH